MAERSIPNFKTKYIPPSETNIPGVIYLPDGPILDMTPIEPCKLFDDLYFIGNTFVGTLVVQTTEGLVLIDSMSSREEVKEIILPGLDSLSLSTKDIVSIIITHGHFDHFGGANYLQELSGCDLFMSKIDSEYMLTAHIPPDLAKSTEFPNVKYLEDNSKLVYGDCEFSIAFTPGHTPGGISLTFPVNDGGNKHVVGIWGGTGLPFTYEETKDYLESVRHFESFCQKAGADVEISLHPFVDYSIEKMKNIKNRLKDEPHPLVIGKERFMLFMYCIMANALSSIEAYEKELKSV